MNFPIDPSSFDPTDFLRLLKNLQGGQRVIITPQKAGNPDVYHAQIENRNNIEYVDLLNPTIDSQTQKILYATWEYKYEIGPQETQLQKLGSEGWELCAVTSRPEGELWIFKRPKLATGG